MSSGDAPPETLPDPPTQVTVFTASGPKVYTGITSFKEVAGGGYTFNGVNEAGQTVQVNTGDAAVEIVW